MATRRAGCEARDIHVTNKVDTGCNARKPRLPDLRVSQSYKLFLINNLNIKTMNLKTTELKPVFVETIDEDLQEGILYISEKYGMAIHLCACGCGGKTVTDLKPVWKDGWTITNNNGLITLRPSIGNWSGQHPYHAHYYITNNKIVNLDNVNKVRGDSK